MIWLRVIIFAPVFLVFLAWELVVYAWTGRKPWREPGRPTCGTHVFGWLGCDVSEYDDDGEGG